jgi:glycosyltransferase involved in cell wall biosynthesis
MKVLHILNDLRPSGAEMMLKLAAQMWQSDGWDLHIVSLSGTKGSFSHTLETSGWKIQYVYHQKRLLMIPMLWKEIQRIKPDVIHVHTEGMSVVFAFISWLARIPSCRTIHSYFQYDGLLRARKIFERWLCRRVGQLQLAISESVKSNEQIHLMNKTILCWNWFDAERFSTAGKDARLQAKKLLGLPEDRIILLSVGNGSGIKNHVAVIKALSFLGNPAYVFVQVGHPHPAGVDMNLAESLGLREQVRLVGAQDDIFQWLHAADLYVMPSLLEGLGIAACEAIASGCDCVFAESPGLVDFRTIGVRARWTAHSPEALASCIKNAIASPLDMESANFNSALIKEFMSPLKRAKEYSNVWSELVSETSASS